MIGKIVFSDENEIDFIDPEQNQSSRTSKYDRHITYGNGKKRVVLVDCGVKHNIILCLLKRNVTVIRVPWDYDFQCQ